MANSDWISPNFSVTDDGNGSTSATPGTPGVTPPGSIPAMTNCTLLPAPLAEDYNVVTATICGLYFMFGVVCTFFGYRCFKVWENHIS